MRYLKACMKVDLHCHSKYSHDNYLEPDDLIEQAIRMGLDGVCFTEHYLFTLSQPVERLKVPEGFCLFRGVEISTDHGHLLAYGVKDDSWNIWGRNNYLDIHEVIRNIHDLGGICVPAHPFRGWDSIGDAVLHINGFDAIETHNGRNSEEEIQKSVQAARTCPRHLFPDKRCRGQVSGIRGLPSIGGSDCHVKTQVGRAFTLFDHPVRTMDELVEEIKKGNCKGVRREA